MERGRGGRREREEEGVVVSERGELMICHKAKVHFREGDEKGGGEEERGRGRGKRETDKGEGGREEREEERRKVSSCVSVGN